MTADFGPLKQPGVCTLKKPPRPKTAVTETFLTPNEAGHLLGIHVNTLAAWRRNRTGPAFIQHGERTIRYRLSELLEFHPIETTI